MESKLGDEEELSRCFELLSTSNVDKKARRCAMDRIESASTSSHSQLLTKTKSFEALADVARRDPVDSIRTRALQTLSNLFDSSVCTPDSDLLATADVVIQLVCDRFSQESSEDNKSVLLIMNVYFIMVKS